MPPAAEAPCADFSRAQFALLNRGVLLTPFHNMVLACSAHTAQDADALVAAFADALDGLAGA